MSDGKERAQGNETLDMRRAIKPSCCARKSLLRVAAFILVGIGIHCYAERPWKICVSGH